MSFLSVEEKHWIAALTGDQKLTQKEKDDLIALIILVWWFWPQIKAVSLWLCKMAVLYFNVVSFRGLRKELETSENSTYGNVAVSKSKLQKSW